MKICVVVGTEAEDVEDKNNIYLCSHIVICGVFKTADRRAFNIGCRNLEVIKPHQPNEAGCGLLHVA